MSIELDESIIRKKIEDLLPYFEEMKDKIDVIYEKNQPDKSYIIYKLNLESTVDRLKTYLQYMLKKVLEIITKAK